MSIWIWIGRFCWDGGGKKVRTSVEKVGLIGRVLLGKLGVGCVRLVLLIRIGSRFRVRRIDRFGVSIEFCN